MDISKFNEKLNKINGNVYVIEEVINISNGIYEAELIHDNVNLKTINVYTGSKLTGDKIETYTISTPSLTPWKTIIKIFSDITPLYISYETTGDQVEAEDINKLQDSVINTQNALNSEVNRAESVEQIITTNLNNEIDRSTKSEKSILDNLTSEIDRAKASEKVISENLNSEISRAKSTEQTLTTNLGNEINRAKEKEEILNENINKTNDNLINEINRATDAEKILTDNLNAEVVRAKASEKTLSDSIANETARAKSSESVITNNLNSEMVRAKDSEQTLITNLNNEINRAKEKEEILNKNINKTNDNLTSEINRATNAEKALMDNLNTTNNNLNIEANRAKSEENILASNLSIESNRAKQAENEINNKINSNKPNWDDKYTRNEIDNKISQVINNMDWKESVSTYSDIAKTYSNPRDGWTVNVKDTDITYRYSGTSWVPISANSIPLATHSIDGKMSKQDKIDHDDMNSKKHTHINKSILDVITQSLINNWNTAYTHISDTVRHITSSERTNWNDAYNKRHGHGNKSILDGVTQRIVDNWNSAYTHISDNIKHITRNERTLWNTVSNKLDKNGGSITGILNVENSEIRAGGNSNRSLVISADDEAIYLRPSKGDVITEMVISKNDITYKGNRIYHVGSKPSKSEVGLSNVDNTSDLDKPISKSTQNALNGKANSSHTHTKSQITDMPTKVSQFINDKGYITQSDVDTSQNHTHNNKSVLDKITQALLDTWNSKANGNHTHDDRYYNESEIDSKLNAKANISHGNHVPKTESANNSRFLRNDNTWQTVTPENLGANKWTYSYRHCEGAGKINYSRILALTITGTYADISECFIMSCRGAKIAYIMVTGVTGNNKLVSGLRVDVFPLTPCASSLVNYFRAGIKSIDANTNGVELWMKMNGWDDCHIYPQTSMRRSYTIEYYNGTINTSFPTFISYVDSQMLVIKASSIQGSITWNDLKGV